MSNAHERQISLDDPEFTPLEPPVRKPGTPGRPHMRIVERDLDFDIDENGCFVLTSHRKVDGYGTFRLYGRLHLAHRAVWLDMVGQIPEDMHLDHLCRNRACINPDHMEVVTPKENTLRGMSPAAAAARQTHCSKGHEYTPETTRWTRGHRLCGICQPAKQKASEAPHGTRSRYRYGCRCDACRAYASARNRAQYLLRRSA